MSAYLKNIVFISFVKEKKTCLSNIRLINKVHQNLLNQKINTLKKLPLLKVGEDAIYVIRIVNFDSVGDQHVYKNALIAYKQEIVEASLKIKRQHYLLRSEL